MDCKGVNPLHYTARDFKERPEKGEAREVKNAGLEYLGI